MTKLKPIPAPKLATPHTQRTIHRVAAAPATPSAARKLAGHPLGTGRKTSAGPKK